jgi:hypothetical protein
MKGKCPGDGALVRLFMNEPGPREKDRLLRHLSFCSRCALRFDVLRQLKRDLRPKVDAFAGEFGAAEAGPLLRRAGLDGIRASRHGFFASLLSLKFAAGFLGVLIVVSAAAFLAVTLTDKRSELRSPSLKLTLLVPVGTVSTPPSVFRWTPVLHAENYAFELTDDSLGRVYSGSTFLVNELVLPADIRSRLVKGQAYLWTISARDGAANMLVSRSGSFVIE